MEVSQAELDVAQAQYDSDYSAFSYYYYSTVYCGCGGGLFGAVASEPATPKPSIDLLTMKTAMLAARSNVDRVKRMRDTIVALRSENQQLKQSAKTH